VDSNIFVKTIAEIEILIFYIPTSYFSRDSRYHKKFSAFYNSKGARTTNVKRREELREIQSSKIGESQRNRGVQHPCTDQSASHERRCECRLMRRGRDASNSRTPVIAGLAYTRIYTSVCNERTYTYKCCVRGNVHAAPRRVVRMLYSTCLDDTTDPPSTPSRPSLSRRLGSNWSLEKRTGAT